jgi:PAS domain S-box-containing protein
MLLDRQGRCLKANRTGLSLMQRTQADLEGRMFRDLWPEDVRPMIDEALQKVQTGVQWSLDAYQMLGSEKRWWALTLAPILDSSGTVAKIISIGSDITFRKQAEAERVAFYEERLASEQRHLREKERLLMELHDGIGGIVTNIRILAEMGQQAPDRDKMAKTLDTVTQLAREGIAEIRSFMHSLDSQELTWHTLATELKAQGAGMLEPHRVSLAFDSLVEAVAEQPGSFLWVNLFRIYKEALTNVIKHAKADRVAVNLAIGPDSLRLTVRDNGIGWAERNDPGRGVANMQKRASELGGTLAFSGDHGTSIVLDIPLPVSLAAHS